MAIYLGNDLVSGGGGSSTAIIDVDTLPTENINANAFYRVKESADVYLNGIKNNADIGVNFTIHIVDELPSEATPYSDGGTNLTGYFKRSNLTLYGYVNSMISSFLGIPVGWYDSSQLGVDATVVTSVDDATETGVKYLVYTKGGLFTYDGSSWTEYAPKGEGSSGGKLYLHDVTIQKETFTETVAEFYAVNLRILSRQSTELSVNDVITAIADGKYTVLGSAIDVDLSTEATLIYPILALGTLNREVISGVVTNPGDLYFEFGVYNIAKSVEIQNADIQAVLQLNGITEV